MTAPGTQPEEGIRHVLAVCEPDGSCGTLPAAAALARRHRAQLSVLVCVEPPADLALLARKTGQTVRGLIDEVTARRRGEMAQTVAQELPGGTVSITTVEGKAFVEIIRHVVRTGIDMVVKTAEPLSGSQRYLFASTDQHLVRKCPCPVWLRLSDAPKAPKTIVAAVDVDDWDASEPQTLADLNLRVVRSAFDLAADGESTVYVLHAWEALAEGLVWTFSTAQDPSYDADAYVRETEAAHGRALNTLLASARKLRPGVTAEITPRLVRGPARSVLADQARALDADLLVMGTVARTGLRGIIIGNTAEDILNSVECSVLTVKPKGFVTPIDT